MFQKCPKFRLRLLLSPPQDGQEVAQVPVDAKSDEDEVEAVPVVTSISSPEEAGEPLGRPEEQAHLPAVAEDHVSQHNHLQDVQKATPEKANSARDLMKKLRLNHQKEELIFRQKQARKLARKQAFDANRELKLIASGSSSSQLVISQRGELQRSNQKKYKEPVNAQQAQLPEVIQGEAQRHLNPEEGSQLQGTET